MLKTAFELNGRMAGLSRYNSNYIAHKTIKLFTTWPYLFQMVQVYLKGRIGIKALNSYICEENLKMQEKSQEQNEKKSKVYNTIHMSGTKPARMCMHTHRKYNSTSNSGYNSGSKNYGVILVFHFYNYKFLLSTKKLP